jgi:uncharacterized protein
MSFDASKRKTNLRKHGIDLADCASVFDLPMLTREDVQTDYGESRFVSLAWLRNRVVVVVWTDRDDGPRFISCREAEKYEKQAYDQAFPQG